MRKPVSLFTLAVATIVAVWWWLGAAVEMPASPLDADEKLYCVSYAPFRGGQSPLDLATRIEPWQIDEDLRLLARQTDCVRTYSVDFGLDRVPEIARRHGLKVMLGLWVSGHGDRVRYQIETGVAVAKQYPDVVRAVIVGNEALLRGEISPAALGELIRRVKAQVAMPVTYADVWEFWLRYREVADAVDFVTIHILPYWEDHPIAAREAANHVDAIRRRVAESFAGKEIMIGEVGWPSAGRMREGALPSPSEQARALHEILARSKRERFRVNVIEAFDQPWKRYQEGTVGGHWGLLTDQARAPKFSWGAPVSNHPHWRWQALGGVSVAVLVFGAALAAQRRVPADSEPGVATWLGVALNATLGGVLVGWTVEFVPIESLGFGGWLRSLALALAAVVAPVAGAVALIRQVALPSFDRVLGRRDNRLRDPMPLALGIIAVALAMLALQAALGLAFDPRYRDFPFAPLTAAAVPLLLIALSVPRPSGARPLAETTAAALLAACAIVIAWNEGAANWQSLWFCAALGATALTLARVRAVPD
jgi:glucan 1,3-beta-glucosidase